MHRLLRSGRRLLLAGVVALGGTLGLACQASAAPLKIGYSDWPGFVAWQIAIDKGWFKEAGVDVEFQWFDYSASLDAFSAGKIDADLVANGDALVIGASGAKSVMIMLTDYSSGNDMIVAKPPFKTLQSLKGQKIGIEVGLVEQLLLDHGLAGVGMSEKDVTLVNAKSNELPQVLASGAVAAVGLWQPSAGMAMQEVPGARPVFTSKDAPGLIYDALTVNPSSLNSRRADWSKIVGVWGRVVAYVNDPKTQADAVKIMSTRDGLTPPQYLHFLKGTHLLTLEAGKAAYVKGPTLESLYGSTENADAFNVATGAYKTKLDIDSYIDPSIETALAGK